MKRETRKWLGRQARGGKNGDLPPAGRMAAQIALTSEAEVRRLRRERRDFRKQMERVLTNLKKGFWAVAEEDLERALKPQRVRR